MSRTARLVVAGWVFVLCVAPLLGVTGSAGPALAQPPWGNYGANPQHTGLSTIASLPLKQIIWQTPVDLNPQYTGDVLYIHYGSPLVTAANTLLVPVKVGAADTFRVEARKGLDGSLLWQYESDYILPAHNWTPSYSPTLTPAGRLYIPGAGGTLLYTDNVDTPGPHTFTRVAFYGITNYNANPSAFDTDIQVCSPLTSDAAGNVFFGYRATGANPLGIQGGLARIDASGTGTFVSAVTATGGLAQQALMNCAPALSNDGRTVYTAMRLTSSSRGYLVALDAASLATKSQVLLVDPHTGSTGRLANDGTASPMVAPDGKVFFGILENPSFSNAARGWLLQFDATLATSGIPGAFGWDDTPSIVPTSMVPSYQGASPYLLMAKYNFYAGAGGTGVNKLGILDPNDTQTDSFTGQIVMKEVLTIAGVTPDSTYLGTNPDAVKEWCINAAAVDPFTHSVLAGSEDGILYRWDLHTNTFTQAVTLTPGIGEAYTPTLIGRDGKVYAINNAILFAVSLAGVGVADETRASSRPFLSAASPNPFFGTTSLVFSLPRADHVKLEIFDAAGRRVAGLVNQSLEAGEHAVRWEGRDADGRRGPAGLYLARLTVGSDTVVRRIVSLW